MDNKELKEIMVACALKLTDNIEAMDNSFDKVINTISKDQINNNNKSTEKNLLNDELDQINKNLLNDLEAL